MKLADEGTGAIPGIAVRASKTRVPLADDPRRTAASISSRRSEHDFARRSGRRSPTENGSFALAIPRTTASSPEEVAEPGPRQPPGFGQGPQHDEVRVFGDEPLNGPAVEFEIRFVDDDQAVEGAGRCARRRSSDRAVPVGLLGEARITARAPRDSLDDGVRVEGRILGPAGPRRP